MRILWWIKRDFRLTDNHALVEACSRAQRDGAEVVPVYVFEPSILSAADAGPLHMHIILQALHALRRDLRSRGGDLLILHGETPEIFEELARGVVVTAQQPGNGQHIGAIVAEQETGTNLTFQRDRRVRRWAQSRGIPFQELPHNGVIRGLSDRNERMAAWRERMALALRAAPEQIPMSTETRRRCGETTIPQPDDLGFARPAGAVQRVDEQAAGIVLRSFLQSRGGEYSRGVSSPESARHTGSRLSVHLAWGTVTLRQVLHALDERVGEIRTERSRGPKNAAAVRGWLGSLRAFRSRLYWHDHFCQRLEREPAMEFHTLNRAYEDVPYDATPEMEERLWAGRTGFPMVDATVRALTSTGFANFRMRAMLVSFATYAMHIDWRRLRDPMARIMADYLPGIHLSQLQMQAGVVGINTVRVYNPSKQILDNDPECTFIRRFVPELRELPPAAIIAHAVRGVDSPSHGAVGRSTDAAALWSGPDGSLGDYPAPLIAFRTAVKSMQSEIYRRKSSALGRQEAERVLEKHGSRRGGGRRQRR